MKALFTLFSCFFILPLFSQENPDIELQNFSRCTYLETPVYLVNTNYVVYQDCKQRKLIYPDMESFRIPQEMQESGIALDKNGIFFQGIFIPADTAGIKLVGRDNNYSEYTWLWKNKNTVFKNNSILSGIDAESFSSTKCLNGKYFKDKHYVYYFDQRIEGSDGASVSKSCGEIIYDKNQVYKNGKILYYNNEKLQPVNNFLAKTRQKVILISNNSVVDGIDAATLKKLSKSYSIDKNYVYYGTQKLPVKPQNFSKIKICEQVNRAFISDGIRVYYRDDQISDLEKEFDASTFGMLPHSDFTYDKNGVYEREWIEKRDKVINKKFPFKYTVPVTPENTFITDNNWFIIYTNQAYNPWDKELYQNLSETQIQELKTGTLFLSKKINNIQNEKGTSLGFSFRKLNDKIYYNNRNEISGIKDIEYFVPLSHNYAKDQQHVYFISGNYTDKSIKADIVENADPLTFATDILPHDNKNLFRGNEKILSGEDWEFLAIYGGYRPGCGLDRTPSTNYYFIKNKQGYWLLELTWYSIQGIKNITFLGKTFNPEWNPVFKNFENPG